MKTPPKDQQPNSSTDDTLQLVESMTREALEKLLASYKELAQRLDALQKRLERAA